MNKKNRSTSGRRKLEKENQKDARKEQMGSKSSREIKESINKDTQGWGMVNWEKISYKGETDIIELRTKMRGNLLQIYNILHYYLSYLFYTKQ